MAHRKNSSTKPLADLRPAPATQQQVSGGKGLRGLAVVLGPTMGHAIGGAIGGKASEDNEG